MEKLYSQIISALDKRAGNAPDRTLERIKKYIELLDLDSIKYIHIAGTNGKGTTSFFIYKILKNMGVETSLFTSPHLIDTSERIKYSKNRDDNISHEDFIRLSEIVLELEKNNEDLGKLTYFEFLFLIFLMYSKEKNVSLAIIETGVGGRYCPTNALKNKLLSIITSISLDHKDYLGETIEEIAKHKAGIICSSPIITLNKGSVFSIIEREANEKNAKIITDRSVLLFDKDGNRLDKEPVSGEFIIKINDISFLVNPKQLGVIRVENTIVILLAILEIFEILKIDINQFKDIIIEVINNEKWPGRMDIISENPLILIDGAHNIDAIEKLFRSIKEIPHNKLYTLTAMMKTKEHAEMLEIIRKNSDYVAVTSVYDIKSEDIDVLKKESNADFVYNSVDDAIKSLKVMAKKDDMILISGSLYLVGMALEYFININNV